MDGHASRLSWPLMVTMQHVRPPQQLQQQQQPAAGARRVRQLVRHLGEPAAAPASGVGGALRASGGGGALAAARASEGAQLRREMEERGYVVVPNAASPADLAAVARDIWAHAEGMQPDDPSSWYPSPSARAGTAPDQTFGFQTIFHTPAMWRTRQSPRIHAAFSELWGTEKLWVSLDRTMLKAPMQPGGTQSDLLHWDFDVRAEPRRFQHYQATLFLEDCSADQGTFQCVPGFHQKYEAWHAAASADDLEAVMRTNRVPQTAEFEPVAVECKAGDLLIWDTFMPHGHTFNTTRDRCRVNQFLTMYPCADEKSYRNTLRVMWPNSAPARDGSELGEHCGGLEAERQNRVAQWRLGCALDYPPGWPQYDFSSGWPENELRPNGVDQPECPLTQLGKQILGLEPWVYM
jgi:ectoine hydroxylase-related dioxygenase (phytanoyl-CoA dioxygenase family)